MFYFSGPRKQRNLVLRDKWVPDGLKYIKTYRYSVKEHFDTTEEWDMSQLT
jgi:hypothetical protein